MKSCLTILAICGPLWGCDRISPSGPSAAGGRDGPSTFSAAYTHTSAAVTASLTLGLWMHREPVFSRETIADWLGVPYQGLELLEPINAVWVDATAGTETEARDHVVDFLDDCGFEREGDVLFGQIPRHSSGYWASYGNGEWREQYDPDDAWVQGLLGGEFPNNHGRIFPAYPIDTPGSAPVYVTSGAFSREGSRGNPFLFQLDCATNRENCHRHISFNQARDRLNCGAAGWRTIGRFSFPNQYPLPSSLSFSTGDHDGVLVFERS